MARQATLNTFITSS